MSNHYQIVGDIIAGTAVLGSLAGYLPEIAAGMAIVYYLFQFYRWLRSTTDKTNIFGESIDDDHSSGPAP